MDSPERRTGSGRRPDGVMTVGQLVRRMRNVLEIEIGEVWVEGEVSNLRRQASGHYYFSLKDENSQVSCAMFGARRRQGHAALEDGAKVRVFGEVTLYEARGAAQVVVRRVEPAGLGDLQARFEALKKKLLEEGLFAEEIKKPLPAFPMMIGLVTSGTGAALQDIVNVLSRRAPWVTAVLYPVQVQGHGAEAGIARAIEELGDPERYGLPRCDVIIAGRGGGSLEDLWNFNEEVVARAIHACPIPVVSAVGHEIDFTIADFVADVRAPTPSAAAELVVPSRDDLRERLLRLREAMRRPVRERMRQAGNLLRMARRGTLARDAERVLREPMLRLDELRSGMIRTARERLGELSMRVAGRRATWRALHPLVVVEQRRRGLRQFEARFVQLARHKIERLEQRLERSRKLLKTLGPESAFERGFSITMTEDRRLVTNPRQVEAGQRIQTRTAGGTLWSSVEGEAG